MARRGYLGKKILHDVFLDRGIWTYVTVKSLKAIALLKAILNTDATTIEQPNRNQFLPVIIQSKRNIVV